MIGARQGSSTIALRIQDPHCHFSLLLLLLLVARQCDSPVSSGIAPRACTILKFNASTRLVLLVTKSVSRHKRHTG